MGRFRLSSLMLAVVILAFELVLIRDGTPAAAGFLSLATSGLLIGSVPLAWARSGAERAWWRGFALAGWAYVLLTFVVDEEAFLRRLVAEMETFAMTSSEGRSSRLMAMSAAMIQVVGAAGGLIALSVRRDRRPKTTAPLG